VELVISIVSIDHNGLVTINSNEIMSKFTFSNVLVVAGSEDYLDPDELDLISTVEVMSWDKGFKL
jgi:hypothetical protein